MTPYWDKLQKERERIDPERYAPKPKKTTAAAAGATGMDFGESVSAEQALQERQARGAELMANLGRDPLEGAMPAEAKKEALA